MKPKPKTKRFYGFTYTDSDGEVHAAFFGTEQIAERQRAYETEYLCNTCGPITPIDLPLPEEKK